MKKVLVRMLIVGALVTGLVGLGVAISFIREANEASHADCICGSFQLQCENCGGLYCQEYACECGRCEGIIDEANVVMSYQEFGIFEEMIWDIYMEEYCVNECEECDSYYYKECMCDSCELGNECYECLHADYEIFIADNYDYIMSIADDLLEEIQEIIEKANQQVLVIYEF